MVKQVISETLKEALELMQQEDYILVSGGTDLMVQNYSESGIVPDFKRPVMYLANLEELKQMKVEKDEIIIGAEVTLETIRQSSIIPDILKEIISEMASPGIRNL
ncbi:MAG TPA: FAD binding domain-containing protein, partial [Candidatus Izemoplasmatales bacterium]|nr:FAD binding domain-containing protein [Candidatus Izemoplasmatales bacterium]